MTNTKKSTVPKRKYPVSVTKLMQSSHTFVVEASSKTEAGNLALAKAAKHKWPGYAEEYVVDFIFNPES